MVTAYQLPSRFMAERNSDTEQHPLSPLNLRPDTVAVTQGRPDDSGRSLNHPIHPASNFRHGGASDARDYSRGDGTDSTDAVETAVAKLEAGGSTGATDIEALAFSSGMAAVSAVFDLLPTGATVIAPDDCYQGVAAVLDHGVTKLGWTVERLATSATDQWLSSLDAAPDLVWLESPSNPLLTVADVPAICAASAERDVLVAVDNTFATPLLQRPLLHGATLSVHSATKFMGGHSDLLAGVLVVNDRDLAGRLRHRRMLSGANIGALEAFLVLRGLRTLPVRLDRSQASARILAERLSTSPSVSAVHYPGLENHPGFEVAKRTLDGPGAVLSFETVGSAAGTDRALEAFQVIVPATSLGGVESTAERRARLEGQEAIPESLVRLSVGCEHVEDLWDDLVKFLGALDRHK